MRNEGSVAEEGGGAVAVSVGDDRLSTDVEKQTVEDRQSCVLSEDLASGNNDQSTVTVMVSNGIDPPQTVGVISTIELESPKKPHLSRNSSSHEQCRVCQQDKEEDLIVLGCQCRGGLSKAHRSCIETWFTMKGSNKCEICQQVAANVTLPEAHASQTYWVWRVDPDFRGVGAAQERDRGCFSPLWVAFSILIGGLLLDVLISITLGVSALPVNIIIGVIVVLGLGTALRLSLEFCHEWSVRRVIHRAEANVGLGYHPAL